MIDHFHDGDRRASPALPEPRRARPAGCAPPTSATSGAWVSQSTGPTSANVSRTLSLVPVTNATWRNLVDSHYSRGAEFDELVWTRAAPRPAVELIAARTTSLNECFY